MRRLAKSLWLVPVLCILLPSLVHAQTLRERIKERLQRDISPKEYIITHDGLERSYLLFVPDNYKPEQNAPLILMLHGGGGNAKQTIDTMTPMNSYAGEKNVIVAYPNGTGPFDNFLLTWNAGACCGSAMEKKIDDVGFIRAVVNDIKRQYSIDKSRVFAAGFSNGAMMSYRLGCEMPDIFSGIASVAGALNISCSPPQPLSVMIIHGTADTHVPYNGGQGPDQADKRHPRVDKPVSHAVDFWTRHNNCSTPAARSENGKIQKDEYSECIAGTGVSVFTVQDGGHSWPGGKAYRSSEKPSTEMSASKEILDFMLKHPKQ
jgi:polyhydroxybutyrate depolymerase